MGAPEPASPSPAVASAPPPFRDVFTDAIRFWEPRRVGYNIVLTLTILGWVVFTWPHFRSAFTLSSLLATIASYWVADEIYPAVV
jgi:hypothetical protein